jgi:tetratricopeptide (TPR) repeat protein
LRLIEEGRSDDPEMARLKAIDYARRALQIGADDPGVLVNSAYTLAYFGEEIGAMAALIDRALALNPNFARGWHISGLLRLWAGEPDITIEHMEVARRLSPRARIGITMGLIGAAHLCARRFDEALTKFILAIQRDPGAAAPHRNLAVATLTWAASKRLERSSSDLRPLHLS